MEEVPFDDRHVPRVEIDWERSAWWWYPLTRAVQPAIRFNSLFLAWIACLLAQAGVLLAQLLFQPDWRPLQFRFGFFLNGGQGEITAEPSASSVFASRRILDGLGNVVQSLLSFRSIGWNELAFISFALLWLTLTFALIGGLLARRSLVELGQRTVAAWGESGRIVFSRWPSYLWAMAMHFIAIALLLLPVLALGAFSRLGSLAANIAGVLVLLMFPLVFAVGRFALSAIVCFPLSVCAIVAEKKADAFEGFSRSNAYFFQRPVVAILCVLLLLLIGLVGEQLVFWTVHSGWWLIRSAYFSTGGAMLPASERYVSAGNELATAIVAAFWFSFFWSGSAATYLVLRRCVDNTELDELDSIESPVERSLPQIPSRPESEPMSVS